MEGNFILNLVTSIGTVSAVGLLFFMWLNTKFNTIDKNIANINRDIERLDGVISAVMNKDDYHYFRKEDKETIERLEERLEKQIKEVKDELKNMPRNIADMLKQFIK